MRQSCPTLHLLSGKIASGKSTLAKELAAKPGTTVICEDDWLARLYHDELNTISDYLRRSATLRDAVGSHVTDLLRIGVSVVLDFPANTVAIRTWMKGLLEGVQSECLLHFIDLPNDECLARLRKRNLAASHAFNTDDGQFKLITSYFVPPAKEEGFTIVRYLKCR